MWKVIWEEIKWKRADKVFNHIEENKDNIDFEDVGQKGLGDCYFQASICALAQFPYRIKKLFPNDQINSYGVYCITLYLNGQ